MFLPRSHLARSIRSLKPLMKKAVSEPGGGICLIIRNQPLQSRNSPGNFSGFPFPVSVTGSAIVFCLLARDRILQLMRSLLFKPHHPPTMEEPNDAERKLLTLHPSKRNGRRRM
ncbi:hypothetical protein TNIN_474261 [Trichonephila inaurata madagascariensis]|uniref:Uncharacterized protein n=1 Tax=Trichonephila inaurata madagascariensis TaxID=2747483 RepID=A0A8X6XCX5_9ARAC|nr:hypothetical protein TNIN_474261 [Trichonephila inaurata madagascariensis]